MSLSKNKALTANKSALVTEKINCSNGTTNPAIPSSEGESLASGIDALPDHWALVPVKDKRPLGREWQQKATNKTQCKRLIEQGKANAVGVITGALSGGLVAVDIDGLSALDKAAELSGVPHDEALPKTVSVTSGKPGREQRLYQLPAELMDLAGSFTRKVFQTGVKDSDGKNEQLDIRFNRVQSVVIGAHPETDGYHWINSPADTEVAISPNWLIERLINQDAETPQQAPIQRHHVGTMPLEVCLAKEHRAWLDSGVGEGSRNDSAYKLACDLLGVAAYLKATGRQFDGDPQSLYGHFCDRCSPAISQGEREATWKSAQKGEPTACLSPDKLENCIKAWERKQQPPKQSAAATTSNNEDERLTNHWNAPASHNGELGFWTQKEIDKTIPDPESGKLITALDDKGKPIKEKITVFIPRANFDFFVEQELSSPNGDGDSGLVLQVQRSLDRQPRRVVLRSVERLRPVDFVGALTRAYGHDISCNLKPDDINNLIHVRLMDYRKRGGKVYKLADRVGCQDDGFWVFPDSQLTPKGEPCTEDQSGWVYNDLLTTGEDKIPAPVVAPPDTGALPRLVNGITNFFGPKSTPAVVFTLGYAASGVHYQKIQKRENRFPILNLMGDPGGCKTIAAECALSLVGNHSNPIAHTSESALYERLKRSGDIVQLLDDPKRDREFDELVKRLYNAMPRVKRGVFQEPHSAVIVTSNHTIGDDQPAAKTRVVSVGFWRSDDGDGGAWDELKDAMDQASGALPQLVKLGYPADKIRAQSQELRTLLPLAHARVADSLGLVLWYAKAVARLAGYDESLIDAYVKETLCDSANDAESNRSSLDDFLDKCQAAVAQSKIGGWNIRAVEDRDGHQFIAVYMPAVWNVVDKAFNPSYSRSIVESGILKAGGTKNKTQRFYRSEDEAKAYLRALIQPQGENASPPVEPETVPRKCVVIPAKLAWELYEAIIPPKIEVMADTDSLLPPLPPVTSCYQGGGNSHNAGGESVSSAECLSVTKNKKVSPLEKKGDSAASLRGGHTERGVSGQKSVTDLHQDDSNASGESVTAVTSGLVTGGNGVVTELENGNSPPLAIGDRVIDTDSASLGTVSGFADELVKVQWENIGPVPGGEGYRPAAKLRRAAA